MSIAREARMLAATAPVPFVTTRARPLDERAQSLAFADRPLTADEWAYLSRIEREAE